MLPHRRSDYVLDEILANETDLEILEHTTDTNGYTDLLFAFLVATKEKCDFHHDFRRIY